MADGYCWTCGRYQEHGARCTDCTDAWLAARTPSVIGPEIILDGCSGAGGAARGMAAAGHHVIGVDTNASLRDAYLRSGAAEFHCASILEVLADRSFMAGITFAWVSPPCQHFSRMCRCRPELRAKYPDLITPSRPLLDAWGGLYVIENVYDARPWMKSPVCLCMWGHFGRETYRHRLLEAGGGLCLTPPASHPSPGPSVLAGYALAKYPDRPNRECGLPHPVRAAKAGHWKPGWFVSVAGHERKYPVRRVMEMDEAWVPRREDVSEAIPPYMSAWVMGELASWRRAEAA